MPFLRGIGDTVAHGEIVLLLPEGDNDATLTAALNAPIADPDRCEATRRAGRARAMAHFDCRASVHEIVSVLQAAAKKEIAAHE